jgi:alkylation response protein AidB-like acyl-CoA dehydrogenase
MVMDFRLTQEQELLRRTVREFAETEVRPHVREWDREQHFPTELIPALASLGLMGIQFPEEYGGAGMSAIDYCLCIEELSRVDPAVALSVAAHNGLCAAHLFRFGSDAAGMRTTAAQADGHWVLNGSKTFTTHGRVGDVLVVMAITDRAAGAKGISAFIIEKGTPGLTPGKKEDKLGVRASDTSEVLLDDCHIPSDQILGQPGQGFVNSLQILDAGRIGIAALAVGLAQGAYEAALRYAQERRAFGKTISQFQAIQWKLADNATRIEAARWLTYRAAYLKDHDRGTTLESAMAKLYASEIAVKAADDCVQIHGGYGFVKDYPAEKYFRDVKLTTIGEGTSEIQRLVIARQLLSR